MIESTFNPATCLPSELLIKNLPNKTIEQDVRRIANILKKQKLNSIQVAQLTEFLNSRSWGSWNEQRIREAVGWSKQKQVRPGKSKNPIDLRIQKGGKSITLIVAGGRHQKGAGTISLTTQAFNSQRLTETIKNKLKLSAWSAKAFDTHQSIRNGKWSSPDFVVCFLRNESLTNLLKFIHLNFKSVHQSQKHKICFLKFLKPSRVLMDTSVVGLWFTVTLGAKFPKLITAQA